MPPETQPGEILGAIFSERCRLSCRNAVRALLPPRPAVYIRSTMQPITFHPKPGHVLICDFNTGFRPPEMVKKRPVVVISESRQQLVTVVPLSTTEPNPIENGTMNCGICRYPILFAEQALGKVRYGGYGWVLAAGSGLRRKHPTTGKRMYKGACCLSRRPCGNSPGGFARPWPEFCLIIPRGYAIIHLFPFGGLQDCAAWHSRRRQKRLQAGRCLVRKGPGKSRALCFSWASRPQPGDETSYPSEDCTRSDNKPVLLTVVMTGRGLGDVRAGHITALYRPEEIDAVVVINHSSWLEKGLVIDGRAVHVALICR